MTENEQLIIDLAFTLVAPSLAEDVVEEAIASVELFRALEIHDKARFDIERRKSLIMVAQRAKRRKAR